MKKLAFHTGWQVQEGIFQPFEIIFSGGAPKGAPVILPQDAMIREARDPHCAGQNQAGYYPAKAYTYTKEIDVPSDWAEKTSIVEFEGVMAKALVYLNNDYLTCHKYGYSGFYADLGPALRPGEKNTLRVVAVNQELASRWYPGSGIYRDVHLWQAGKQYFVPDGMRLTTAAARGEQASVTVAYEMVNADDAAQDVTVTLEILDGEKTVAAASAHHVLHEKETGCMALKLNPVRLWSPDDPHLHTVRLSMRDGAGNVLDTHEETVGIRHLSVSAEKGLCINGKTVKLRGACIHHDNGIIGATTLYAAEEFRLKKMKEAGFNSIRSAHHPASKAILDVCDRLGMLVMDELADMWREQKNANDFALDFPLVWQDETERMVRKDYNHACVVLYSTGNEIPEIGRPSGWEMNRKLVDLLHRLDGTRFVTNAANGFLAVSDHLEEIMPRAGAAEGDNSELGGGSEQLNAMAGLLDPQWINAFSVHPVLSRYLLPVEEALDVAGYNYLTARHEYIHGEHPDWVVAGSETYPPEITDLWPIVERNAHVIGDFTWTGYDYLGEAGIGIFHYDTGRREQGWYPDRVAYCGDIDLNGYRRPVSHLREIAYGLRKTPYLFVRRVDRAGQSHDVNPWKYHDGIHSWTFPGHEGVKTLAYVLTCDPEAELFLNGRSLGKKRVGEQEGLTAIFEVPYEPGMLTVRTAGGEDTLITAGSPAGLRTEVSKTVLAQGGQDVCFITADLVDENGIPNRFEARIIEVRLEGDAVLAGFGSANPSCEGSYSDTAWETYDGRVMAAVRSGMRAGKAVLTFLLEGKPAASVTLDIR